MEIEKNNNKELVPLEHYLEEYAKASPEEMSSRTGFPYDTEKQQFQVTFFGRKYVVTWPEFSATCLDDTYAFDALESMNPAKILVVRFLLEGATANGTGKFLTYREVPWGELYYRQFNGRCMMRLAFSYGNRLEEFVRVMEKMKAKKIKAGDEGYEIELFSGFFIRFQLWGGDEEFPPSSQILFSDNFPVAFHAEDLVVACDVILGTMKQL